jgi:hypothetical protein
MAYILLYSESLKFVCGTLTRTFAGIRRYGRPPRQVVEFGRLSLQEPSYRLRSRDPPTGETRSFQADALAIGTAHAAGDPANQTTQGDGLALTMGRKAPPRPRQRFTVAGGDLVVDQGHFATSLSPLMCGDLDPGSTRATSPVAGLRRITSTTS